MADPIESTYFDTMSIHRMVNVQQPNGSFKQERVEIATNIKCALSMSKMATVTKSEVTPVSNGNPNNVFIEYRLYCNPTVDVRHGDELVITSLGRQITAVASAPMIYESHQILYLGEYRNG